MEKPDVNKQKVRRLAKKPVKVDYILGAQLFGDANSGCHVKREAVLAALQGSTHEYVEFVHGRNADLDIYFFNLDPHTTVYETPEEQIARLEPYFFGHASREELIDYASRLQVVSKYLYLRSFIQGHDPSGD